MDKKGLSESLRAKAEQIYKNYHSGMEYEIFSACDGVRGIEQIKEVNPDLVILDFHMPQMSGYEVVQTLITQGNTIPIIMMTAAHPEGLVRDGIDKCDAYLPKPFTSSLLYYHVQHQLSRKSASKVA